MAHLSPKSTLAICDFVENLCLGPVAAANDGSYSFAFERAGILSFTPSADGKRVVMSLRAYTSERVTANDMVQFFKTGQRDSIIQAPISAGMVGSDFVLAANFRDAQFNHQQIELCLDRLIALHGLAH